MPFRPLAYLKFLLKSTNEHGVHSPFVFDFVTRCLYGKERYSKNKSVNVLLKSVHYFKAKNLHLENNSTVRQIVQDKFEGVSFENHVVDILFLNHLNASLFYQLSHDGKLHNDSMILIDSIHDDPKKEKDWDNLVAVPEITVSIDMFYCGAVFIRKEQAKQHFTIRI